MSEPPRRDTVDAVAVPRRVCLLRLSALGDCANVVPVVHTLQAARPDIEITWVINRAEAGLVADLPGVECLVYDKHRGRAARRDLRRALARRDFDVLLDMHASWRANMISRHIKAGRRIGFDARRARDGQRLFVNERIAAVASRHVVDGFLAFAAAIGAGQPVFDWRVPVADADRQAAAVLLDASGAADTRPILFISPCSSHSRRNWQPARYAAAADHAVKRHAMRVVLVGGPSTEERAMADAIRAAAAYELTDLVGRSSLKQLIALLEHGRMLLTPDSGPAHMANATAITTIALHAATDPRRSGPYRSRGQCVDYFAQAAASYRDATPDTLKWGTRIEDDAGVMALIPVDAVTSRIDAVMMDGG
ncbi:glycosyltransferase family 9 protein [Salinisphaera sp. Q1T1-3]|uniref:glycosyltransferase family 9 protein n=1 Tax=Salinisphaera sp. Q1T1-3 TaxID=2321229 RepID=UPI000E769BF0|nr:glycosyltransferase family 9 protein [Salinisphaera sp. Q1T1-3]RJS94671.1 lipopolysaccharide heptosyltransferase family protein [Salinisphaera sp. Q1T1-3]